MNKLFILLFLVGCATNIKGDVGPQGPSDLIGWANVTSEGWMFGGRGDLGVQKTLNPVTYHYAFLNPRVDPYYGILCMSEGLTHCTFINKTVNGFDVQIYEKTMTTTIERDHNVYVFGN